MTQCSAVQMVHTVRHVARTELHAYMHAVHSVDTAIVMRKPCNLLFSGILGKVSHSINHTSCADTAGVLAAAVVLGT